MRAARVLGIAQPVMIGALARLSRKLFERSRRGVTASDLGCTIIAEGSAILERLTLKLLPQCDAVSAVSVTMAMDTLWHGDIVALPWQRAPWASIHPGIITLRNRAPGAVAQDFLEMMRAADQRAEKEAIAWCKAQGVPSGCG
ncbi:MAG: hypothetical protein INF79_02870 [Roseomonas sp.]|nr:hypothetical protein [Roseomonas sp.]